MASKKRDEDIQRDVVRELSWDTRVSPAELGVQVKQGVVTLTGEVESWAKRQAAEQAAHRVSGVLEVASDLEVRIPGAAGRSDSDIARTVRQALEWDVLVPDREIRSTVSDGVVKLEGVVPYGNQRYDAEQAVERLAGVRTVVNRIEVRPPLHVNPGQVRLAIQSALERRADREAARIDLTVHDGAVDVVGIVNTVSERDAVLGAVRGTRGVRTVVDRLAVRPFA
jgi:osmotically-inducible protein OsmY